MTGENSHARASRGQFIILIFTHQILIFITLIFISSRSDVRVVAAAHPWQPLRLGREKRRVRSEVVDKRSQ